MPRALRAVIVLLLAAAAAAQEAPPTVRSETQVVVLDLVATDRKGRPIEDLREGEVLVSEDGRACEILSFRLVRARTAVAPAASTAGSPAAAVPPGDLSLESPTPARASLVVLLFDRLTTASAPLARKGALDLVSREFPPDTWFAVLKIDYGVRQLAPFTTSIERLRSAIEAATVSDAHVRGSRAPGLPPVKVEAEAPEAPAGPDSIPIPDLRPVAEALNGEELSLARRVEGYDSLYAIVGVARALAVVEGRKSVVYFAEGWHLPVGARPVYDDAVSAANRANVAVHTVDARGLTSHKPLGLTPMDSVLDRFTADHREEAGAGATTPPMEAGSVPGREPGLRAKFEKREEQLSGPRLPRLSEDTGGLAIADTNDLGAGLDGVAEELRQYYEVVYAPADPVPDGRFRRIGVKIARPGVRLRTRSGYFATPGRTPTLAPYEMPLVAALAADPPARDFALRTGVLHFAPKGAGRECVVLARVPLSEVQVARDVLSGVSRAHLALVGYVKDEGGRVVARLTHDWPIERPSGEAENARPGSALFRRALPLAPGRYSLEVAVQDRRSGGCSVTRSSFVVPPAEAGLALGSVTVVRSAGASGEGVPASDPLRVGAVSLVPDVGEPFDPGASPEVPVLVTVYPGSAIVPVELTVAFRRDGREIARATPELAAADSEGRIAWIGSLPAGRLAPGTYEVVATAKQGEATAEETARFEIAPGARAAEVSVPPPPDAELAAVLERAARYVVEYQDAFRNLVAEEHYTQKAWGTGQGFTGTATAPVRFSDGSQMQTTRADLVFVRLAGETPWGVFRDVFEVNGNKVRDRDERLAKLFRDASPSAFDQARRILGESARYNIGPWRTVNLPTMALLFLHPRNQARFAFEKGGHRRIGGFNGLEVRFEEVQRPPITTDSAGGPVPVDGRFWIDPARGTVLRSETRYRFEPNRAAGHISTEYRNEPRLGMWVPLEMTERYRDADGTRDPVFRHPAEATARYSNFRQFEVTIEDQKATLPPG